MYDDDDGLVEAGKKQSPATPFKEKNKQLFNVYVQ